MSWLPGCGGYYEDQAWDDYNADFDTFTTSPRHRATTPRQFTPDPDYYHDWFTYKEIKHETDKAWLLVMTDNTEVWMPKSLCHEHDEDDNTLLLHKTIAEEIIKTQRERRRR